MNSSESLEAATREFRSETDSKPQPCWLSFQILGCEGDGCSFNLHVLLIFLYVGVVPITLIFKKLCYLFYYASLSHSLNAECFHPFNQSPASNLCLQ